MTNRELINKMTDEELLKFFENIDFNRPYPIIEGIRFFHKEDIIEWLNKEAEDVRIHTST